MHQHITPTVPAQAPRLTAQQRLTALFSCCMKSHVVFRPASARLEDGKVKVDYVTRPRGPSATDWQKHFAGVVGLGLAPQFEDNSVLWASFDSDAYTDDATLLVKRIGSMPVIPVRSKSHGLHGFVFFEQPTPRQEAWAVLRTIVHRLGLPEWTEILPRSDYPFTINIPYFGLHNNLLRAQVGIRDNGLEMGMLEFVRAAEKLKLSAEQVALYQDTPVLQSSIRQPSSPRTKEEIVDFIGPPTEIVHLMRQDAAKGKGTYTDEQIYGEDDHVLKTICALQAIPADIPYKGDDCCWFKLVCAIVDNIEDADQIIFDWALRSPHERHWSWDKNLDCNRRALKRKKRAHLSLSTVYRFADEYVRAALAVGHVEEKWRSKYHRLLQEGQSNGS